MSTNPNPFKILTYNIHKGFTAGNFQFVLEQIRSGIRDTQADIVFLQEVQGKHNRHAEKEHNWPTQPQFEYLADSVWSHYAYGQNAVYNEGHHGNAILSKFPILSWDNTDISTNALERRGVVHAKILIPPEKFSEKGEKLIHLFCVHLNLFEKSRVKQIKKICQIIQQKTTSKDTILLAGDFNDWTFQASKIFAQELGLQEAFEHHKKLPPKTFPSFFPLLSLDRIYFRGIHCIHTSKLESKLWRKLSDHIPLLAEFDWKDQSIKQQKIEEPIKLNTKTKLLLVVDDWEKGEHLEKFLAPFFEVDHAPFGLTGIEMLEDKRYENIFVNLELNDMSEEEFCLLAAPKFNGKIYSSSSLLSKNIKKSSNVLEFLKGELTSQSDSYVNENGYSVFTAHYLKQRGYCCQNGCRHCPYSKK